MLAMSRPLLRSRSPLYTHARAHFSATSIANRRSKSLLRSGGVLRSNRFSHHIIGVRIIFYKDRAYACNCLIRSPSPPAGDKKKVQQTASLPPMISGIAPSTYGWRYEVHGESQTGRGACTCSYTPRSPHKSLQSESCSLDRDAALSLFNPNVGGLSNRSNPTEFACLSEKYLMSITCSKRLT